MKKWWGFALLSLAQCSMVAEQSSILAFNFNVNLRFACQKNVSGVEEQPWSFRVENKQQIYCEIVCLNIEVEHCLAASNVPADFFFVLFAGVLQRQICCAFFSSTAAHSSESFTTSSRARWDENKKLCSPQFVRIDMEMRNCVFRVWARDLVEQESWTECYHKYVFFDSLPASEIGKRREEWEKRIK